MVRLLAGAAVLLMSTVAFAEDPIGKLTNVQGQVTVRAPGSSDTTGTNGTALVAGTMVRTHADGSAEVAFTDGSVLRLQKNTSIQLSPNKRQKQKKSVLLFFGRLWNKVTPSGGEESYEVSTPNAVCGVRGTEFETSVGDDGSMRMQVTEGKVAVRSDGREAGVAGRGQQVEANEEGAGSVESSTGKPAYEAWAGEKRDRLSNSAEDIVKKVKSRIMTRAEAIEKLRARQKQIESQRKQLENEARSGSSGAISQIKKLNQELATIADQIAQLGDEAGANFGLVDHFADLANDPRFKMVGRKNLEAEAASLRRVKANLDKMVAEGTDISMKAMDKMLEDMSQGKGSLKEGSGSAGDELFGNDPMR